MCTAVPRRGSSRSACRGQGAGGHSQPLAFQKGVLGGGPSKELEQHLRSVHRPTWLKDAVPVVQPHLQRARQVLSGGPPPGRQEGVFPSFVGGGFCTLEFMTPSCLKRV